MLNKKIRQEHTILPEFHELLNTIADLEDVQRIIPGRIHRKQSGSSNMYFSRSYETPTGRKYKMSKGSTSQEVFVICDKPVRTSVAEQIEQCIARFFI